MNFNIKNVRFKVNLKNTFYVRTLSYKLKHISNSKLFSVVRTIKIEHMKKYGSLREQVFHCSAKENLIVLK